MAYVHITGRSGWSNESRKRNRFSSPQLIKLTFVISVLANLLHQGCPLGLGTYEDYFDDTPPQKFQGLSRQQQEQQVISLSKSNQAEASSRRSSISSSAGFTEKAGNSSVVSKKIRPEAEAELGFIPFAIAPVSRFSCSHCKVFHKHLQRCIRLNGCGGGGALATRSSRPKSNNTNSKIIFGNNLD